jgi:membrane protease subunit (stomatin/prohibitin family)
MPRDDDLTSRYAPLRALLRTLGPIVLAIGAVFMVVGFIDFLSAFGSFGGPQHFWCFFVGMPLVAAGVAMTRAGYLGVVAGYVAGEVAPVGKDVINYMAEGTEDTVAGLAQAVGEGLSRAGAPHATHKACPKCHAENAPEAKFCSTCGTALAEGWRCAGCGHANEAGARFCDECGRELGATGG